MFVLLFTGERLKNRVLFGKSAVNMDHRAAKERRDVRQPGVERRDAAGGSGAPPGIKVGHLRCRTRLSLRSARDRPVV
ncbi:hypothetical protein GCM10009754_26750 [Amycolatopsis minnesotensis]|uniref:Uncharacterized protein n=1 Tax=Amycolatopsis minnesotensis TaxID=337894 RepID=A0ABP5C0N1_9PSEU